MPGTQATVHGKDGAFSAYVAKPASGAGPAVVVIQEIFGVNHWIRDVADGLAGQGFVAVAPDLFWRIRPGIELDDRNPDQLQEAFKLFGQFDVAKGVEDIAATIAFARGLSTGKVGAVGFCLGGLLAYLTGTRTDADATSSYYGVGIDNFLSEAESIKKPMVLHIAEQDKFVSPDAQSKIKQTLANNMRVSIFSYKDMDHAFARAGGEHYNATAAEAAGKRTLDLFKTSLY
jgi:carboxymethylenebutenolidase